MKFDCNSKSNGGPRIQLNCGYWMPLVGLGTYKIVDQTQVDSAIDAALASGYRHFDTAKLYKNEIQLGNALEKYLPKHGLKREDIFITTKFFPVTQFEVAQEKVASLIEESLANLKTSFIDLVLIHYPKPEENANEDAQKNAASRRECWIALEKLHGNKVHSIGVSNYEVRHLEEMAQYTTMKPAVNQVEYHPHFRRDDIKQYCHSQGIFFQAFSSLARQEPKLLSDPKIVELAQKYNTIPQNVILSFATSQGVGIVPKSANPERIKANIDCLDLKLSEDDLQELNNIPSNQHYIRTTPWLVL